MQGLNKVMLIGYLGADPDMKYLPSGDAVANFRVATNESWKDKQTGEKQTKTEWHSISAFGRLAEICGEYLRKGDPVYVEGKLNTRKWQDRDGNDRWSTGIIINQLQMLGSKRDGDQRSGGGERQQSQRRSEPAQTSYDDFDDDIPF